MKTTKCFAVASATAYGRAFGVAPVTALPKQRCAKTLGEPGIFADPGVPMWRRETGNDLETPRRDGAVGERTRKVTASQG